ncbi:MAG: cytochrome ubiquinol oxidase subunit I [Gammaproteobacteria bacterium]|jgi:cytochrome d ubiquinol oxidase subunit I|nr:cytochrome ubiquinol oxidase subunit I [Gammaproteobacteria bacterium]
MPLDFNLAILSRVQFAFTIGFHIIWPTLTIGLGLFLLILETLWLKTKNTIYKDLYRFWAKIFALAFGMGIVTGIPLSYQFGTNFSGLSETAGAVLGPLLSVEVMTAFFLEAAFIGVMLFGWEKVSPSIHFMATCFVVLGTHNSAFWIIAANSWMHTPQGVDMNSGIFVVNSWWKVIFNPSMPYRFIHSLISSYLTASLCVVGVCAWYLLKQNHIKAAQKGFSIALIFFSILAPLQIILGDMHGIEVLEYQPVKVAAMEGLWDTTKGAPLVLFAVPNSKEEKNEDVLSIPKLTSFILTHDFNGEVKGLKNWPKAERPPVATVFYAFRIMVGLGFLFLFIAIAGVFLRFRKNLLYRPYLWLCALSTPLGFIATISGWIVAEVGRQPYVVYGHLKTVDALSPVIPEAVFVSLIGFIITYSLMFFSFLFYCHHLIKKGPQTTSEESKDVDESEWLHVATHTTHLTQDRKGEI